MRKNGLVLRPYQHEGSDFLFSVERGILADDMGLGKTIQTIDAISKAQAIQVLVICPSAPRLTWRDETKQWTDWSCVVVDGNKVQRDQQLATPATMHVIHYDVVRYHVEQLSKVNWTHIVLDEGHRLKNRKSKTFKAVNDICVKTKPFSIYALTGTPMENRAEELWSLLHILYPIKYKSYWEFISRLFITQNIKYKTVQMPIVTVIGPRDREVLKKELAQILLRREAKDVEGLPDSVHHIIRVPLSPEQKVAYKSMYRNLFAILPGQEDEEFPEEVFATSVLAQLVRLRQISISVHLLDNASTSIVGCKLSALLNLLQDIEGKVVLFSQFSQGITRFSRALNDHAISNTYFTGDSSLSERSKAISRFSDSEDKVFLTTLQAGGVGINGLQQSSSTAILADRHWNPSVNKQAIGRLKRIGAMSDVVNVFSLVADKTIEDKIEKVLSRKQELFDDVIPTRELINILRASKDGFFED